MPSRLIIKCLSHANTWYCQDLSHPVIKSLQPYVQHLLACPHLPSCALGGELKAKTVETVSSSLWSKPLQD